jgi:hypothetical protein
MLIGAVNLSELEARAPGVHLDVEPLELEGAEILQVLYEMPGHCREPLLPPALHPTDPPVVAWLLYRCPSSPWGPFAMAQTRIECRSGLRLRAYLVSAVVDNEKAAEALRRSWAYAPRAGVITWRRHYDEVRVAVEIGAGVALEVVVSDPDPLAPEDVQYVAGMHAAKTAKGLRLLQVEPRHRLSRAERGRPRLLRFDAAACGDARIEPVHPISASLAVAGITLPPVRFVCRPDVLGFEGTEVVSGGL